MLVILGSCGVQAGMARLMTDVSPPLPEMSDLEEGAQQVLQIQQDALWHAPGARPLAAGNIVVSSLLFVTAVMLSIRRKSAVWWLTQAVIANVAFTAVHTASALAALNETRGRLWPLLLERAPPDLSESAQQAFVSQELTQMSVGFAVSRLIPVLLYGWLAYRLTRPDMRALLAQDDVER